MLPIFPLSQTYNFPEPRRSDSQFTDRVPKTLTFKVFYRETTLNVNYIVTISLVSS